MARKARRDFAGAWHHLMNRGARRAPIFKSKDDRLLFLEALGEAADRYAIEIHTFSLMPNHFHLFARSVLGNVSLFMRFLTSTYALRINVRERWDGPLFRGRFTNQIVGNRKYQRYLVAYIHLNPVLAALVRHLDEPSWTSHRAYMGLEDPPSWLVTSYVLGLFNGAIGVRDFTLGVKKKKNRPDLEVNDGWFSAPSSSKESGNKDYLSPVFELPPSKPLTVKAPKRVLKEVCSITGSSLPELLVGRRGKGANPARRFAIWALRRSTACSNREIAEILQVPYNQVVQLLYRLRKGKAGFDLEIWIRKWEESAV